MKRLPAAAALTWSLVFGLAAGMLIAGGLPPAWSARVLDVLEPIGTLWVDALRMTIVPLVVSLLIVGVAGGGDARHTGVLGLRAFAWIVGLLAVLAAATALLAPWLFHALVLDPAATAALRTSTPTAPPAGEALTFGAWLVSLIPTNPFKAASDGALIPLVVFTLAYAFALAGATSETRGSQVRLMAGVRDVMLRIVRAVLALGALGVFALAVPLGARLRGTAMGALGLYVAIDVGFFVAAAVALYALVALAGRVPLARFARAVLPAQSVAFGTRSSLAALPALIEGARAPLGLPEEVADFALPLGVSVFKLGLPVNWIVGALFVARLYGVPLGPEKLALVAAASVALNATAPGIPGGGLLVAAPVFALAGLPVAGVAILLAIDGVVDTFRTALNVTADMAVAVLLARGQAAKAPRAKD